MRTSVILNLKGGVAKTATAVNLAAILARGYRKRVLLVDADSQCNATEFFGGDPAQARQECRHSQGASDILLDRHQRQKGINVGG